MTDKPLKGSQTEANLWAAFAGESHTMLPRQKKTDMFKLPIYLKKRPITKKNMPKFGLNYCMTVVSQIQLRT